MAYLSGRFGGGRVIEYLVHCGLREPNFTRVRNEGTKIMLVRRCSTFKFLTTHFVSMKHTSKNFTMPWIHPSTGQCRLSARFLAFFFLDHIFCLVDILPKSKKKTKKLVPSKTITFSDSRHCVYLRHLRADAREFGRVAGERFREVIVLFDAQRIHGTNDLERDEDEAK